MDDAFVMCRPERVRDLLGVVKRRVDGEWASQGLTFDQFHDQGAFLDTIDVGNVRMIERGQDLPFTLKPGTTLGILRYRRRQHLDRNFAFQPRVPSPIHLAHAARAEFRFHAIEPSRSPGTSCVGAKSSKLFACSHAGRSSTTSPEPSCASKISTACRTSGSDLANSAARSSPETSSAP